MSRQKNSVLINDHALNREPVPLIQFKILLGVLLKQTFER